MALGLAHSAFSLHTNHGIYGVSPDQDLSDLTLELNLRSLEKPVDQRTKSDADN